MIALSGQHEDARMCLALAMTSVRLGAHALNYTEVTGLLHREENGEKVVCGAKVKDKVSSKLLA